MARTVTAAALTIGARVLVDNGKNVYGEHVFCAARRKTAMVARVLDITSELVDTYGSSYTGRQRKTRKYTVVTSVGTVTLHAAHTFWLAPEDAPAIERARTEAQAEDAERAAAAPVVEAPVAQADDLDSMKFAQVMELAKQLKVPGRGTARLPELRAGVRAALAA